jgi:uncharacterized membrane protein
MDAPQRPRPPRQIALDATIGARRHYGLMSKPEIDPSEDELPAHIQDALGAINHLHAEHARRASVYDRAADRLTGLIARPRFIAWLIGFVAVWALVNTAMPVLHRSPFDPPPYNWLQGVLAFVAVALTSLVLATQRRADDLAGRRAQLALELAIFGEQKSAKIIALIEELRRDSPNVRDREDEQARDMARPADTALVLEALGEGAENPTGARKP